MLKTTKTYNESNSEEETDSTVILREVSFEKGFHFSLENGDYLGVSAISLADLISRLRDIDSNSVAFHYYRGDFQKWISEVLGDKQLATRLCFIQRGLSNEELRNEILTILEKRMTELKGLEWVESEGI